MKRAPSKKGIERRKRPRSTQKRAKASETTAGVQVTSRATQKAKALASTEVLHEGPGAAAQSAGAQIAVEAGEHCQNCGKALMNDDRALFVEEEMGRVFCSEAASRVLLAGNRAP